MKKIYQLTDAKKNEERVLEAVKNDIRKYFKREKKKPLAEKKTHYWDFDCKIGKSESDAKVITSDALIKELDAIKNAGASEVYVEILVKMTEKPLKVEETATDGMESSI